MSYVIEIRRAKGAVALTEADLARLLNDPQLGQVSSNAWLWTSLTSSAQLTLTWHAGALSTDDINWVSTATSNANTDECLNKLRAIARELNAQVLGEEGENLSEPNSDMQTNGWAAVGALLMVLLMLPFMLLFLTVRLPWLVWKLISKPKPSSRL